MKISGSSVYVSYDFNSPRDNPAHLLLYSVKPLATKASAGGQLDQPSDVNNSTTTKPLLTV